MWKQDALIKSDMAFLAKFLHCTEKNIIKDLPLYASSIFSLLLIWSTWWLSSHATRRCSKEVIQILIKILYPRAPARAYVWEYGKYSLSKYVPTVRYIPYKFQWLSFTMTELWIFRRYINPLPRTLNVLKLSFLLKDTRNCHSC